MDHEYFAVDHMGNGHPLEDLGDVFEQEEVIGILAQQLLVEPVLDVDDGGLVVAAVDVHELGVGQLVGEQQEEALDRAFPLVHDVSVEKVHVSLRGLSYNL